MIDQIKAEIITNFSERMQVVQSIIDMEDKLKFMNGNTARCRAVWYDSAGSARVCVFVEMTG